MPGHVPARCEEEVLPAARRVGERRRPLPPRARCRTASSPPTTATAGSSPTTATTIRATPATSSRRWRRRRTAFRTSCELFARELASLDPAAQPRARRGVGSGSCARLDDELIAARRGRRAADADHRRSDRQGAGRGAALPARAVLPAAELRVGAPRVRERRRRPLLMEGIALTGAWVDKERGLLSLIALELGVSSRLVRVSAEGRAGRRDGPDRRADRNSRTAERAAARRRPRQRRAVLDRQGDARARQQGDLLRRLQEGRGSVQARGDRGGDRSGDLEHRHRRGDRAAAAAGRALPRQHRPGDARVSERRARRARSCRSTPSIASSPSARTG